MPGYARTRTRTVGRDMYAHLGGAGARSACFARETCADGAGRNRRRCIQGDCEVSPLSRGGAVVLGAGVVLGSGMVRGEDAALWDDDARRGWGAGGDRGAGECMTIRRAWGARRPRAELELEAAVGLSRCGDEDDAPRPHRQWRAQVDARIDSKMKLRRRVHARKGARAVVDESTAWRWGGADLEQCQIQPDGRRKTFLQDPSSTYWTTVDKELAKIRKQAKGNTVQISRLSSAFRHILKKDRAKHGVDNFEIEDTVDPFQEGVDEIIEERARITAYPDASDAGNEN
ncbi:hypothetical protein B0H11DRAFT_1929501 [Mycena galericulata]|nr:hypothetical protein B0H11DRAFT_1929501 [Mycena galericulata]